MLHRYFEQGLARAAQRPAVGCGDEVLTYAELDALADRFAARLQALGVGRGDRVGLWSDKAPAVVAAMLGTLRLGAAYVPIDPLSPPARVQRIVEDCAMKALVLGSGLSAPFAEGKTLPIAAPAADGPAPKTRPPEQGPDELAYILYTSGSTGTPKGVCLSHRNATAFVDWAIGVCAAGPDDRFANHAPFFFDLSVLDLYVAQAAGARVQLVPEVLAFSPKKLVELWAAHRFTVWYSVPSALILMMEQGGLLEHPLRELRRLLFAGEPFPVAKLRPFFKHLPHAELWNLYGPTETNVCTAFHLQALPDEQTHPISIGTATCGDEVWVVDDAGKRDDAPEAEGELWVGGPTVMLGYWGQPPQQGPYPTGDLVKRSPDGSYQYKGRRDSMLKVRGRRMEAQEIESVLRGHPNVAEVAVVAKGSGLEAKLFAYVVPRGEAPSLLALKQHCAAALPRYMIVDQRVVVAELPRTRNGKLDRTTLTARQEP